MQEFQVFVKPVGARCNLSCSYCYYLDKKELYSNISSPLMTDELLEAYMIQHLQASSGPEIFFSWHGGEPTLAGLNFYKLAISYQKKHNKAKYHIVNGIQTNGTLLNEEWCRFLKKEHFVVGISLDGPEEFHSSNRTAKNGKSTYQDTVNGLKLLRNAGIPCEILCVVNSLNVKYPLEVYRFFKSLNVQYITFLPLVERKNIKDSLVSENSVLARAFGEFLCKIFNEWVAEDIGKIKIQIIEETIRTAFNLDHTLCIFKENCGGVPVIEANGDFYACDHYVNKENHFGNIRTTSLKNLLESDKQRQFGEAKSILLPAFCRSCDVLSMCNGACPKDRFIATPDGEPGLNYLCEGYRMFFSHCQPFVEEVRTAWGNG